MTPEQRAHEDYRLLLFAKHMSYKTITVANLEIPVITIGEALKYIGAQDEMVR